MAYRLKNRYTGVPQAIRFTQPELNWTSRPGSFDNIVGQIVNRRLANPAQTQKYGWSTDPAAVADELDSYMAKICVDNGWGKFVHGGEGESPPPTFARPDGSGLKQKLEHVAAGGKALVDWIASREEAVGPNLSEYRAGVCSVCPQNRQGDLTSFFTVPAAKAIRHALNMRSGWNLKTSKDPVLGVCRACSCPLELKVHLSLPRVLAAMNEDVMKALDPKCWILGEMMKPNEQA